jgi:hypothetical protein
MSQAVCQSCGAANEETLVYCSACGALLEHARPPDSGTAATALARRRTLGINREEPSGRGFFARLVSLLIYLLLVAAGVIVVLACMDPRASRPPEEQRVPDAKTVVRRVFATSRFTPSVLSQAVINSLLAQLEPYSPASPLRFLPMPVWEHPRVDLAEGRVTLCISVTLPGKSLRLSETFRLTGSPGAWSLEPESATLGLLDLPAVLLPAVTPVVLTGILPVRPDVEALAGARSLAIRPGLIEFTTR